MSQKDKDKQKFFEDRDSARRKPKDKKKSRGSRRESKQSLRQYLS